MAGDVRDTLAKEVHPLPGSWTWEWFTDVMDIEGGTQPPASEFVASPRNDYVRLVQIRDFEADSHITFIPDSPKWRKCRVSDVLIARYGAALGRICTGLEGAYNVALAKVVPGHRLYPPFMYYLLNSEYFQAPLLGSGGRSAQAGFNRDDLSVIALPIPPLSEQRAIAHILGTLDDKIELNRRMSETLEALARALFKSWFVDFDPVRAKLEGRWQRGQSLSGLPAHLYDLFPDGFTDSELGQIPEGWEVKSLDGIAGFLNGLALQKFPPVGDDSLPVIKIAQLRAGTTAGADRASASLEPDYIVEDGDILFSWSGSLECVLWSGGHGALNQHLFKVTSTVYPRWLFYLAIHHHINDFRQIAAGKATTMGHIQRHHLSEAKLAVPSGAALREFDKYFVPNIESLWKQAVESRTLANIRDTLLPKMISGELRVKNVEKIIM